MPKQLNILRKDQKAQWYKKNKKKISAERKAAYIMSSLYHDRKFDNLNNENHKIDGQIEELMELRRKNQNEMYDIAKIESERNNPKFKNYFSKTRAFPQIALRDSASAK